MTRGPGGFTVGAARREISPPDPRRLVPTGMGRREPTFGVFDPLFVEAAAIGLDGEAALLITADLRYYPSEWVVEIRETLGARLGLDPWRVLFSATHNHCSSPVAADRSPEAAAAEAAANRLIRDSIIAAGIAAFETRRPAEMATGTTRLAEPIGQNRRIRFAGGTCVNGWGAGPVVPPGQRIVGPAGPDSFRVDYWCAREPGAARPFALLVSYATHPHLYELPAFSGEFPGAAKRQIAERLGGALVMQASHAAGDIDIHQVHPMPDEPAAQRAWFRASADRMGARLADAVCAALPAARYGRPARLRHDRFTTEPARTAPDQRSFNLVGIALDDAAIVSMPGELFHEDGLRIHSESPFANLCLMAYNGSGGAYLAPPLGFEQGSYEVHRGPAAPSPDGDALAPAPMRAGARVDTGQRLVAEILALLRRLRAGG